MKKLIACLLALSMLLMLAACGGGASSSGAAAPEASSAGSEGDAGSTPAASGDGITITIMDAQAYALERSNEVLENFAKENGITLDIQHAANDYNQLLMARINSDQIPDLFVGEVGAQLLSLKEYALDLTGDPILDKFREDALQSCTLDGEVYALPWISEAYGFIYNRAVFQEAGIDEENLPQTLDELEALCQTLQGQGITPFANGYQSSWVLGHMASTFVSAENPDSQATAEQITNGELTFADMKYFKNIFPLIDLTLEYGPAKPLEVDWERSESMLSSGEAAMIHMGNWCEAMLLDFNPDVDVAFMPMPITNEDYAPRIQTGVAWGYIINKDSPNVDIVKQLVEYYLTSEDGVDWMSQDLGAIPPTKEQPASVAGMLSNDASKYVAEGLSSNWAFQAYPQGANEKISDTLQAYAAGDITQEQALETIQNEWMLSV